MPQWQDPGDDEFEWEASEDEDGGRVMVRGLLPNFPIHPTFRLNSSTLEIVTKQQQEE